jgi:cell division protein FtsW (lipid II flippase)
MTLPIVWWVALLLLAVQLLLWKRRAGTFLWTLVSWFSLLLFLRFGFTVPVPQSVISLYMGIVTLATIAYVTSSRDRLQGFTRPVSGRCSSPWCSSCRRSPPSGSTGA